MPREKVGFREQLEHLSELFPGRESLGIDEVCKLLGLSRDTLLADESFPFKRTAGKRNGKIFIPIVPLALWLVTT